MCYESVYIFMHVCLIVHVSLYIRVCLYSGTCWRSRMWYAQLLLYDLRRLRFDLLVCYKILQDFVSIRKADHFKYPNPTSIFTRSPGPKLVNPICHSNKIADLFLFCHIDFLNFFPYTITHASKIAEFKGSFH